MAVIFTGSDSDITIFLTGSDVHFPFWNPFSFHPVALPYHLVLVFSYLVSKSFLVYAGIFGVSHFTFGYFS